MLFFRCLFFFVTFLLLVCYLRGKILLLGVFFRGNRRVFRGE